MTDNSRIVTAPDLDLDDRFKILLVDVEWADVERLSSSVKAFNSDITLFLYGSNDTDDVWCINAHKHAYSTLINSRFSGNKEFIKGWLLSQKNTWCLGSNDIGDASHRTTHDIYSWITIQYNNYLREKEESNG